MTAMDTPDIPLKADQKPEPHDAGEVAPLEDALAALAPLNPTAEPVVGIPGEVT